MATIDFSRGDAAYHTFQIPATSYVAGSELFFAAKPVIDDDNTDANALIQGHWTDVDLLPDVVEKGITYKVYNCHFPPTATNSILSNGAESAEYLGEFQLVNPAGVPVTIPPDDPKLDVVLYFDIKRKTTA